MVLILLCVIVFCWATLFTWSCVASRSSWLYDQLCCPAHSSPHMSSTSFRRPRKIEMALHHILQVIFLPVDTQWAFKIAWTQGWKQVFAGLGINYWKVFHSSCCFLMLIELSTWFLLTFGSPVMFNLIKDVYVLDQHVCQTLPRKYL
jgi:hypothetical protein